MLNPDQIAARDGRLTASRVACLMSGDTDKIMNLWRELIGDPDFTPDDLSGVWPVQLGSATEHLNLDWFARKHGTVSRRGEVVEHSCGWAACTLDGWSDQHGCPIEAKHVGGREPLEIVVDRYQPQLQWQMIVTGALQCALSIILAANEPIVDFIPRDDAYCAELWARAESFMECVWTLTPPVAQAPVAAPVIPAVTYDMSGNNQWASEAVTWLTTRQAKRDCDAAEKALKGFVPADAVRCHGYGIEIKRDRAGRLSIKELK